MHTGVDFRMPARWLGNSVERGKLRKNLRQRPTTAQRLEEHVGPGLAERAFRLFPNALGDECIDFARGRHAFHQDESVFGHTEAQVGISSSKASDA